MAALNDASLIVFTRYPEPGRVKTRLIPKLGAAGAAELHRRMTLHTLATADRCGVPVEVRYAGGEPRSIGDCFGHGRVYQPQGEGDLGQRMARAFEERLRHGPGRAVILGSDCPALTAALLRQALAALAARDVVLGPAADGGYYLIGLRRPAPSLFRGIEWGTERVLAQTLDAVTQAGLSMHLLPRLSDVDRPQDLPVWRRCNERLSVIVPTLHEQETLGPTLERMTGGEDVEVIVVDCGSRDQTRSVAESFGVKIVISPPGRAIQMNRGAAEASGGRLLFCHADTLLPTGYDKLIHQTLSDPQVALGAFSLRIASHQAAMRRIELGANFRSRRLKLPYGDQGLFLRRETFEALGGFHELRVMEDFDLVRRARRLGRVVTLHPPATTSARRWLKRGAARTTVQHQLLIASYWLGLPLPRRDKCD